MSHDGDINPEELLRNVYTCPICGQHKTHHRLYGYRCNNPEHAEREKEMRIALGIPRKYDKKKASK